MDCLVTEASIEYNRGTQYVIKNNFKKALPLLKKSLSIYESKECLVNMGNCYRSMNTMDAKMMECYKRALDVKVPTLTPGNTEILVNALNNLGLAYYSAGDDTRAIDCYTKAIKINPKAWEAWWNCSTARLRQASSGNLSKFPEAWEMYKARFLKTPPVKLKNHRENMPFWDTISSGEDIIILVEQGIGDCFMWGRYLSEVAKKFKRVFVQADPSLWCMFQPEYKCVIDAIEVESSDLVAYPICSLSECFPIEIPPADWLKNKFLEPMTFPESDKPNVGIVWQGNREHLNDKNRSLAVNRFHCLTPYVNLYSLDPSFKGSKHVNAININSWDDTARAIRGLDLVISIDTSVIHLCGALGVEAWVLQPLKETDFRWGNGVNRCVWYPNIEIFNNPNSWEFVFAQVITALKDKGYA